MGMNRAGLIIRFDSIDTWDLEGMLFTVWKLLFEVASCLCKKRMRGKN